MHSLQQIKRLNKELSEFKDIINDWTYYIVGRRGNGPYAGYGQSIARKQVKVYLINYVLKHKELPTGRYKSFNNVFWEVDFGILIYLVVWCNYDISQTISNQVSCNHSFDLVDEYNYTWINLVNSTSYTKNS